jgi:excisionase family DNA binding protein
MGRPGRAVEPRLYRLPDAAIFLGVSVSTVYQLVERGALIPLALPGLRGLRFDRADLETLVKDSKRWKSGIPVRTLQSDERTGAVVSAGVAERRSEG